MSELHVPWLEMTILTPLLGIAFIVMVRRLETLWRRALLVTGLTLVFATCAWLDFATLHTFEAHDRWDLLSMFGAEKVLVIDELNAPLLPLTALLCFLTTLMTLRTKLERFPFMWTLISESLVMAILACREPWVMIGLLGIQTLPMFLELRARNRPTRVFLLHMLAFWLLLVAGWLLLERSPVGEVPSMLALGFLVAAILIRSGSVPVHCWMTDLFENASFASALLFVAPMAGASAAITLVLPRSPDWALHTLALLSLVTSIYAAGMALVQRESRRFFCYLFLSHSSLVLVGLEMVTPIGLTGALCVWLSVGLSLTGFGLTLRAIEARTGRLSLDDFHGLYEQMPTLAGFFLLTGLASVGFPGTVGFVGAELLVEGVIGVYPLIGMLVVLASALNGIAVLHAYFRLFTGAPHVASISLRARLPERIAVLVLTILILGGGLFPQSGVASRYHAAEAILARRAQQQGLAPSPQSHHSHHAAHALLQPVPQG